MNLSIMFGSMIGGMFLMNIALNYLRCYPYHPLWYFYIMARYLTDDAPSLTGKNNVKQLLLMYGKSFTKQAVCDLLCGPTVSHVTGCTGDKLR